MEKNATLNLRVNSDVKKNAELILSRLGISMATAVDMYLRQIAMVGGIPFPVTVKPAPESVDAGAMTAHEIRAKIHKGIEDVDEGRVRDIDDIVRMKRSSE